MGFSRQEYWSGLSISPPGDLPDPGIEPVFRISPILAGSFFTAESSGKSLMELMSCNGFSATPPPPPTASVLSAESQAWGRLNSEVRWHTTEGGYASYQVPLLRSLWPSSQHTHDMVLWPDTDWDPLFQVGCGESFIPETVPTCPSKNLPRRFQGSPETS